MARRGRIIKMENKVALIGIVVENFDEVSNLNAILHEYADFIIGRMGIPYKKRDVSIISVAVDAPTDVINALSGKIGKLSGVTSKTVCAKIDEE